MLPAVMLVFSVLEPSVRLASAVMIRRKKSIFWPAIVIVIFTGSNCWLSHAGRGRRLSWAIQTAELPVTASSIRSTAL